MCEVWNPEKVGFDGGGHQRFLGTLSIYAIESRYMVLIELCV